MLNTDFNDTFKNWTFLNFTQRIFFLNDGTKHGVPANQYQDDFFRKNFLAEGMVTCTFKEFRDLAFKKINASSDYLLFSKYYDFDHRKPDTIKYGTVNVNRYAFYYLFKYLDEKHDSLESGLRKFIMKFEELKKLENDKNISKEDQQVLDAFQSLKTVLKMLK